MGGALVRVAAVRRLRQVDLHHVVRRAPQQPGTLLGVDDVVGRRDDELEAADLLQVVVEGVQGRDVGHGGGES
jgi:hypothetical protein